MELIECLENKRIYIYGTGFIGTRFCKILRRYSVQFEIAGFVVSSREKSQYDGFNVFSVKELGECFNAKEDVVCIAVHEALKDTIENELRSNSIEEYIWVYPFFHDLCFGKPIKKNVRISTHTLLERYLDDYAVAIRLLAIEQYYGKNECGYRIYEKGMELHCERDTAKKRLDRFLTLIKQWENDGYDEKSKIKITEQGDILDGVHRVSLAFYHKCDDLLCDVYHVENYNDFIDKKVRFSDEYLSCFLIKEQVIIREEMNRLKKEVLG